MAVRSTDPNHDDSPWYKIMEDKGKVWNKFSDEAGANINVHYNAFVVEFEMIQQVKTQQTDAGIFC